MSEYILVLNLGSSSLKFTLFEIEDQEIIQLISGNSENIGILDRSQIKIKSNGKKEKVKVKLKDHKEALVEVFNQLEKRGYKKKDIKAVGHRVVHGGDKYMDSVLVNEKVEETIKSLIPLAPLHNPVNLTGICETEKIVENASQVAVFDTAFHSSLPKAAYRYAVPEKWFSEYGVRRYGFHGTSHKYVSRRACALLQREYSDFNAITVHLGNGSSLAKIEEGKSTDTSMGFTPLEGVIMGSRSGDIDPAIIEHVAKNKAEDTGIDLLSAYQETMKELNKKSGLLALAGTNLMQDIRKKALDGDKESMDVIDIYVYRIAKYIGAYASTMDKIDAIIFCAGVGENESYIRKRILQELKLFNFKIDDDVNENNNGECIIGESDFTNTKAMIVETDEEIVIGYDTLYLGYYKTNLPDKYPFEKIN